MQKHLIRTLTVVACLFLVSACSPEKQNLSLTKPAATQHKVLDVQNVKTQSGIETWLVEDHSVPVISMAFSFDGGMNLDPQDKPGVARMVSILLDEGAGEIESQEFQKILADNAIGLSFSPGRDTFSGELGTITDNREIAFEMLRLALTEPRFDAEAVERMRQTNLAGIKRDLGKPGWLAARSFNGMYFEGHNYANPGYGNLHSVSAITVEDLRGFATTQFARSLLKVSVAGDITAEELSGVIDRVFGSLPEGGEIAKTYRPQPQQVGKTILLKLPTPQTFIVAGHPGIMRDDPDWHAASVMMHILGSGSFSSRLMEEIREKRGLTYSVYASMNEMDYASVIQANMSTSNDKAKESLDLLRVEWDKMAAEGVTESELADAKAYITGSLLLHLTSTDSIAGSLNGVQREGLGIDYINTRNDMIRAVTQDDIKRVAKKLLHSDRLMTILVGAPEGIEPDIVISEPPGMGENGKTEG